MSARPSFILGTAGHIDHGKSSLIHALTGTDPDRLAEEKRRGITIELGFAQLELSSGRSLGVVDVPGHERFLRSMVAGASGVDVALMVIAADDGIMPQTIEHLAVLELLGVRTCVVALTKVDLVDDEWQELIKEEIAQFLAGTPFEGAPIIGVSSRTGEGLDALRAALDSAVDTAAHIKPSGPVRMPIDRVFTIKGFGTVVTGTLWSGTLCEGDSLKVLPQGITTRVRSIQMHGHDVSEAASGNRVAVSLAGLSTEDVRPGDFLSGSDDQQSTDRADATFTFLDPLNLGKPLKSGSRVHVAHGTREVLGRLLLMDGVESLSPQGSSLVQLRLEEPLPLAYGDHYIIRSYSPTHVIGGGVILAAHPRRRTNLNNHERLLLDALVDGDTGTILDTYFDAISLPQTLTEIVHGTGLDQTQVTATLDQFLNAKQLLSLPSKEPLYCKPAQLQRILQSLERALITFHSTQPQATGMAKEQLRQAALPQATPVLLDALISAMEERKLITRLDNGEVSHPSAGAGARQAEAQAANQLESALIQGGAAAPTLTEYCEQSGVTLPQARKAAQALEREGRALRLDSERFIDAATAERCREAIRSYITTHGPATAAELRDALGVSRKYAMPILERLDLEGLTYRDGDLRKLSER